ncbi:MAG: DUF3103 family protein [Acidobacteria bacterium]|nr:DUF3103 family protein [Acidobacteriota bacterium]
MKKLVFAALALMTVTSAWAQAGQHRQDTGSRRSGGLRTAPPVNNTVQENEKSLNPALREVAQALAAALGEKQTRRIVKQEVGKKFDGDFDVLYRDIANHKVGSGRTFRQALGSAVGKLQKRAGTLAGREAAFGDLDSYASALPQLQISIPVGFKDWDAESTVPLVAFVPADVDDDDLREVEAFDATGRRYLIDAQTEPSFPVVVVGLNERTDRNGYLRPEFAQPHSMDRTAAAKMIVQDPSDPSDPGGDVPSEPASPVYTPAAPNVCDPRAHAAGDHEFLHEIKINNDHEPWFKGSPEIYATYSFVDNQGIRGQFFMSNVDDEGRWYSINGPLFYWQATTATRSPWRSGSRTARITEPSPTTSTG